MRSRSGYSGYSVGALVVGAVSCLLSPSCGGAGEDGLRPVAKAGGEANSEVYNTNSVQAVHSIDDLPDYMKTPPYLELLQQTLTSQYQTPIQPDFAPCREYPDYASVCNTNVSNDALFEDQMRVSSMASSLYQVAVTDAAFSALLEPRIGDYIFLWEGNWIGEGDDNCVASRGGTLQVTQTDPELHVDYDGPGGGTACGIWKAFGTYAITAGDFRRLKHMDLICKTWPALRCSTLLQEEEDYD